MTTGQFQPLKVPADQLDGSIIADVLDPGAAPVTVVRHGDDWKVAITWSITGELVDWLTGSWHAQIVSDKLGGGELAHPAVPVAVAFTPGSGNYSATVAMKDQLTAGTYDLVVNLTTTTPAGTPGMLSGFVALSKTMVQ
jgi:hypothetical protein